MAMSEAAFRKMNKDEAWDFVEKLLDEKESVLASIKNDTAAVLVRLTKTEELAL